MKQKRNSLFVIIGCVTLLPLLFSGCANQSARTLPVQIPGKPVQAKVGEVTLIVNGDDVGITPLFTDSTLKAVLAGHISSASICPGSHDADRAIRLWKEHPELEIGVHLTLNGDWKPLTPKDAAPSLYSKAGTFWNTSAEARANVKPEHAKREWDAQIKKVKNAGIRISHLDSHMGCYFLTSELLAAAYELSRQYNIPLMAAYHPSMPAEWKAFLPIASYAGIYNVPGKSESLEHRTEAYLNLFKGLSPGVHYLFTHQGILPEGQQPYGDLDIRNDDYQFWSNGETKRSLKEMGIAIKPFSSLKEVFNRFYE